MKFSIVTISFNQARYLEEAILSVLNQEYADIEYIIVDPGSTDGSREIIERYRKYFAHVIFEKDSGPADGLNKGFARATGQWFGYINSDDYYLPGGISKAAIAAAQWPDSGALVGDGYIVDGKGMTIRKCFSKRVSIKNLRYDCAFALQQATFYRADVFRALGGFNISNRTSWDGELLADMVMSGYKVKSYDQEVGAFRIHDSSITGSGHLFQEYQRDADRIRELAFGRTPTNFERRVVAPAYRFMSYFKTPARTAALLSDRFSRRFKIK